LRGSGESVQFRLFQLDSDPRLPAGQQFRWARPLQCDALLLDRYQAI